MSKLQLKVDKREALGSKVKNLREKGLLPANVYGPQIDSLPIKLSIDDFLQTFRQAGETELVYLKVKGESDERPVLIREVQAHPVTNRVLHVDFAQIDLSQETTAIVPLNFVGTSPAVKEGSGILLELTTEIEVRSLPTNIPSKIDIDISQLHQVDDFIEVQDLPLPEGVKTTAEETDLVCKIEEPKMEELEEELPEEEILPEEALEEEAIAEEDLPETEIVDETAPTEE